MACRLVRIAFIKIGHTSHRPGQKTAFRLVRIALRLVRIAFRLVRIAIRLVTQARPEDRV
eukprot:8913758-Karenia_brevis.AAC.1